jgi:hypothetical protein
MKHTHADGGFGKMCDKIWVLLILSIVVSYGQTFTGRVGASHDGNQHDYDDIGAAAWDIGIFAKAGARLVHDDYADHLADNDTSMEHKVEASALGSAQRWYGSTSMCYNDQHNLQGAINNIAAQINASSASNRFYYILCGPMEVPYRGIMAADSAKRKYCTCISHSGWNDSHTSSLMTHTWSDIQKTGVTAVHIADQNTLLNDKTSGAWDWAKNASDEKLRFMWDRMATYGVYGDISDAGMAWYVITGSGDQGGTNAKLKTFFTSVITKAPPVGSFASPSKRKNLEIDKKGNILVTQMTTDPFERLEVFKTDGRLVARMEVPATENTLRFSSCLQNGTYVFSLRSMSGAARVLRTTVCISR